MDNETGESYRDDETGEVQSSGVIDDETGEMTMNYTRPTYKKPFKVTATNDPHAQLPTPSTEQHQQQSSSSSKRCQNAPLKRVSVAPAFAILTLLFFVPICGIFTALIECLIHVWTHKKNKTLRATNHYYRSPFHDITCEFCSLCIDESTKNKITKLQDKRNYKLMKYGIEYVRRIVT